MRYEGRDIPDSAILKYIERSARFREKVFRMIGSKGGKASAAGMTKAAKNERALNAVATRSANQISKITGRHPDELKQLMISGMIYEDALAAAKWATYHNVELSEGAAAVKDESKCFLCGKQGRRRIFTVLLEADETIHENPFLCSDHKHLARVV